jgi:hypothetical protein
LPGTHLDEGFTMLWQPWRKRVLRAGSLAEKKRPRRSRALILEQLEDRVMPSLLGLAQQLVEPAIISGGLTHISYNNLGNGANPFHYDARPLSLTLGDGTVLRMPANFPGTSTRLDVLLDNTGKFAADVPGNDFTVTGKVTIDGNTFSGTLLTDGQGTVKSRIGGVLRSLALARCSWASRTAGEVAFCRAWAL